MSKEKTPIEELIEYCKKNAEHMNDCNGNNVVVVDYELMRDEFDSLLKKEREAIEEAYTNGWYDGAGLCDGDSKQYYNDKYGK